MKNALLFITGTLIGTGVTIFAIYTIYTNINPNAKNNSAVVPKQNLEANVEASSDKNTTKPEELPQTITLPEISNVVTLNYRLQLQGVINSLNTLINSNNQVIVPIMKSLPQKLQSGNWGNVFDEVKQVKVAIKDGNKLIETALVSLSKLQQENNSSTKNNKVYENTESFIQTAVNFTNSFKEYLTSSNELLTGNVPTKEQVNDLNTKISDLEAKTEPFRREGTNLFLIIKELNPETAN